MVGKHITITLLWDSYIYIILIYIESFKVNQIVWISDYHQIDCIYMFISKPRTSHGILRIARLSVHRSWIALEKSKRERERVCFTGYDIPPVSKNKRVNPKTNQIVAFEVKHWPSVEGPPKSHMVSHFPGQWWPFSWRLNRQCQKHPGCLEAVGLLCPIASQYTSINCFVSGETVNHITVLIIYPLC